MAQKLPKLEIETLWLARLTSRELTIIRQALRGELREEFKAEAADLELELARLLITETKHKIDGLNKLERNLPK